MSSNLCAYRTRYTSAPTAPQSMSIYYANRASEGPQEHFFKLDILVGWVFCNLALSSGLQPCAGPCSCESLRD